jgi:hypothetical protein
MAQHVHKYRRTNIGRDKEYWVMRCTLPGCTSYTPMRSKWSCPMLEGKLALCNTCNEGFILDRRALLLAKPICDDCVDSPKAKRARKAMKFLNDVLDDKEQENNTPNNLISE